MDTRYKLYCSNMTI